MCFPYKPRAAEGRGSPVSLTPICTIPGNAVSAQIDYQSIVVNQCVIMAEPVTQQMNE